LVEAGAVKDSGVRRKTRSGRNAAEEIEDQLDILDADDEDDG